MKKINWDNVQEAKEYPTLKKGGYIARIIKVEDFNNKEYLKIYFDIEEGEFKGHFKKLYDAGNQKFWAGNFIRSYSEKAQPFFKNFYKSVEKSNGGYVWDDDETTLSGKLVGVVFGEEEYLANDGTIKVSLKVTDTRSVATIRSGEYKVREIKKLDIKAKSINDLETVEDDSNLPF